MRNKTLVKFKIVLEDNGTSLVTYVWKKQFLFFGYWHVGGSSSSNGKVSEEKINRINEKEVSSVLFQKFIRGFN